MKKVTKAFADIPLYKLNNKHITNLFHKMSQSLSSESTCKKTVLKFGKDRILRVKTAVEEKNFSDCDESILFGAP